MRSIRYFLCYNMYMTKGNNKRGNPRHRSTEASQKIKYQKDYLKWRKVYSPALKKDVEFTNLGLIHITKTTRTLTEKITRLKLLSVAKHVIGTSPYYQGKRFQNFHDHYVFEAVVNKKKVRVLVREDRKRYYFYSVFYIDEVL